LLQQRVMEEMEERLEKSQARLTGTGGGFASEQVMFNDTSGIMALVRNLQNVVRSNEQEVIHLRGTFFKFEYLSKNH